MQDYAIQRSSRKCYASNRPLEPGERTISAIVQTGSELARRDYALDTWNEATANDSGSSLIDQTSVIGWWRTTIPQKKSSGPQLAPPIVLVDTLSALLDTPGQDPLAYLLALLLIRRRILVEDTGLASRDDEMMAQLDLRFPADERIFIVPVVTIPSDLASELQAKLADLLFTEE